VEVTEKENALAIQRKKSPPRRPEPLERPSAKEAQPISMRKTAVAKYKDFGANLRPREVRHDDPRKLRLTVLCGRSFFGRTLV
jgi:hypothetical protein